MIHTPLVLTTHLLCGHPRFGNSALGWLSSETFLAHHKRNSPAKIIRNWIFYMGDRSCFPWRFYSKHVTRTGVGGLSTSVPTLTSEKAMLVSGSRSGMFKGRCRSHCPAERDTLPLESLTTFTLTVRNHVINNSTPLPFPLVHVLSASLRTLNLGG